MSRGRAGEAAGAGGTAGPGEAPDAAGMAGAGEAAGARRRIARALVELEPRQIPTAPDAAEAAVALVLRGAADAPRVDDVEGLFVQRAELAGDPWSGHMALPGGRRDASDADLLETARREAWEETSLELGTADFLGRLSDIHPRSPELPSIVVTPFVAWPERKGRVRGNREIRDHVWVPLRALSDPSRRTVLELRRRGMVHRFPGIEYEGYTIWGLTFQIVTEFLDAVAIGGR